MEGSTGPNDGTIVVPEAPEQKDYDSPVVEEPGDTLNDRPGHESAALMIRFFDIVGSIHLLRPRTEDILWAPKRAYNCKGEYDSPRIRLRRI